jgi:hypothetical protein
MSDWQEDLTDIKVFRYNCPYCPALAGEWCITKSGRTATWLHSKRGDEVQQLVWAVMKEDYEDAAELRERLLAKKDLEIKALKQEINALNNFKSAWVGGI